MNSNYRLLLLLLCLPILGWTQGNRSDGDVSFAPVFSLQADFNGTDLYTGLALGVENLEHQWSAKLGTSIRPFRKVIQLPEENGYIYQYHERKFFLFLELDKRFLQIPLTETKTLQLFAGARPGVLFGNYSGTQNDATPLFTLAPMGGACLNLNNEALVRLGYTHVRDGLVNVGDGRIHISFTVIL